MSAPIGQHLAKAAQLLDAGLVEPARGSVAAAFSCDPEHPWAHFFNARLLFAEGNYRDALGALHAAALYEEVAWHCWHAIVLGACKKHRQALAAAREATSIDPQDAGAWYVTGLALSRSEPMGVDRNRRRKAFVAAMRRAIALAPDRVDARLGLADIIWAERTAGPTGWFGNASISISAIRRSTLSRRRSRGGRAARRGQEPCRCPARSRRPGEADTLHALFAWQRAVRSRPFRWVERINWLCGHHPCQQGADAAGHDDPRRPRDPLRPRQAEFAA